MTICNHKKSKSVKYGVERHIYNWTTTKILLKAKSHSSADAHEKVNLGKGGNVE